MSLWASVLSLLLLLLLLLRMAINFRFHAGTVSSGSAVVVVSLPRLLLFWTDGCFRSSSGEPWDDDLMGEFVLDVGNCHKCCTAGTRWCLCVKLERNSPPSEAVAGTGDAGGTAWAGWRLGEDVPILLALSEGSSIFCNTLIRCGFNVGLVQNCFQLQLSFSSEISSQDNKKWMSCSRRAKTSQLCWLQGRSWRRRRLRHSLWGTTVDRLIACLVVLVSNKHANQIKPNKDTGSKNIEIQRVLLFSHQLHTIATVPYPMSSVRKMRPGIQNLVGRDFITLDVFVLTLHNNYVLLQTTRFCTLAQGMVW